MCRYMQHPVKTHWACLPCRYTSKHAPVPKGWVGTVCPRCRLEMVDLGRDFRAPRHDDQRQWRKVAMLFERGIRFDSCGCRGPGARPATLSDARARFGMRRQRRRDIPAALTPFASRRRGGRIRPARLA